MCDELLSEFCLFSEQLPPFGQQKKKRINYFILCAPTEFFPALIEGAPEKKKVKILTETVYSEENLC